MKYFILFAFLICLPAFSANAALKIDITRGNVEPLPIAVLDFKSDSQFGENIAQVITADLERSGLFRPLSRNAHIENAIDVNDLPLFKQWRVINALALVSGSAKVLLDGRLRVEFRLWDSVAGEQMEALRFSATPDSWRRIAHFIADAIYERLTGETGYFDTRIIFVAESGTKDKRIKKLAIMDQDGYGYKELTDGGDLTITPRFSPTAQEVTYMSYANNQPRVYLFNTQTGNQEVVGDFPGMTFAPRFSPDGQKIIMSLERNGYSNIYTLDLRTRETKQLTASLAIDTAPCFSPDGSQIVFESDRVGSQQLYVMNADGSNIRRISYGEGRYATPVWSPRGDLIAFTKTLGDKFLIGVMKTDGSGERILTEGFHNEGPAWAPNGRVIAFFRESKGEVGGPNLWTVDVTGYNERPLPTPNFASDPSWSPLTR